LIAITFSIIRVICQYSDRLKEGDESLRGIRFHNGLPI
jgi:hypothetical protein